MTTSSLYDEYYYAHDCGRPYQRDDGWLNFFDQIAKRIIEQFEPKTVLDVGCAWGFLVEAFRNRGVEAFGVDISEYAIQNIYPDIKPYCWIGSITEPFPKKYDLITCIEVLEHMPRQEAEKAIENLCSHANEIVFSSTPFDYKEATHFNVHDPEYWAEQFARYGFYRDMDADMSCITSWAVRFVKTKRTSIELVREYERKFWQLRKENFDLRQLSIETQDRLRQQENQVQTFGVQVAEKEQAVAALTVQVAKKEQALAALMAQVAEKEQSLQVQNAKIREIYGSRAWRLIQLLWHVRTQLIPHRSRRERFARTMLEQLRRFRQRSTLTDYDKWITANEPSSADLTAQLVKVKDFDYKPLISVVVPVWNTPAKILDQTIRSVVDQTYDKWELCIADGNSNPETKEVLSYWAKKDLHIKVKFLDENKGIAVNSNEALSLAQGEFVAFLDHDDLLAPFALFEDVLALQQYPNADLIYSDEDLISSDSKKRFGPHFKPAFNPDLLRSINYITHFMVIRKTLGDKIGWLRNGYEGAQDYDLTLRAVEWAREVVHIPKVLYHWRHWPSSTTNTPNASPIAKKYADESGKKALKEHLERCGLNGVVEDGPDPTTYQVRYSIIDHPLVSIIILNRDHPEDLHKCILSIRNKSTYENYEIIVVEKASREEQTFRLYNEFKEDPSIRIIEYKEPFNFSSANNFAVGHALGDILLFLNNDTEVISRD
ncbi:MAG TPA: glycosyltransferase, partial [Anaerolineales bacterium]